MPLLIVAGGVLLLLLLVLGFRMSALFALVIAAIAVGLAQGMDVHSILVAIEKGVGDTLAQLALIFAFGVMLGKLIADGGGAQRIAIKLLEAFGRKNMHWAMALTGFIVGIPLFYNVGFVILIPMVFMICANMRLPIMYVAIPLLAALSVTHGYLPPHPGATAVAVIFGADIGLTMLYGAIVSVPAIIVGGPIFARTLGHIQPSPPESLVSQQVFEEEDLPSFGISLFTSLFPVFLIAAATVLDLLVESDAWWMSTMQFVGHPIIALLIAVLVAVYTMGVRRGVSMKQLMERTDDSLKSVAVILFVIAAAGAFKEVLVTGGVGDYVAELTRDLTFSPLILVWLIAAAIRIALGSATVAALTTAGIALPMLGSTAVSAELMVLATGAGSLMFSHINDPGFWLFKEYFGLSIKETIKSWSVMETVVSVVGLLGVLLLDQLI